MCGNSGLKREQASTTRPIFWKQSVTALVLAFSFCEFAQRPTLRLRWQEAFQEVALRFKMTRPEPKIGPEPSDQKVGSSSLSGGTKPPVLNLWARVTNWFHRPDSRATDLLAGQTTVRLVYSRPIYTESPDSRGNPERPADFQSEA